MYTTEQKTCLSSKPAIKARNQQHVTNTGRKTLQYDEKVHNVTGITVVTTEENLAESISVNVEGTEGVSVVYSNSEGKNI